MSQTNDLLQRLTTVLEDLRQDGMKDREAMLLIGGFATQLVEQSGKANWSELKRGLTANDYDLLLAKFQSEGTSFHKRGDGRAAYAVQALATALVAKTDSDKRIRAGSAVLDELIDASIVVYRQVAPKPPTT